MFGKEIGECTTSQQTLSNKTGTPQVSFPDKKLKGFPAGFPALPERLKQQILGLGERTAQREEMKAIIKDLCSIHPLTRIELAKILHRNPTHLRFEYLSEIINNKELEFIFPDQPAHPNQAYKTPCEDCHDFLRTYHLSGQTKKATRLHGIFLVEKQVQKF